MYTTDQLLSAIQANTLYPTSSINESETDVINMLNEELLLNLTSEIKSVQEEFFLTSTLQSISANISLYPVPARAFGNTLKHVFYKTSSGTRRELFRMKLKDMATYDATVTGEPYQFFMQGDEIKLFPTPTSSGDSLEIWYYLKPNKLIQTASCAQITGVSTVSGTTTLTVDTDLTASLSVGDTVDFLSGQSPYLLWVYDVVITAITTTTISVATTDIDDEAGVSVLPGLNDWICPAGYSNIPMVPEEYQAILITMVHYRSMLAIKDQVGIKAAGDKLALQLAQMRRDIQNRVEDQVSVLQDSYGIFGYQSGVGIPRSPFSWR